MMRLLLMMMSLGTMIFVLSELIGIVELTADSVH